MQRESRNAKGAFVSEHPVTVNRLVVVGALAAALGVASTAIYLRSIGPGGGPQPDDQPPIIVSDGSIIFEGGDKYNPKKGNDAWTQGSKSKQQFHAVNSNGFKVQSFTAYVAGVADSGCQTTLAGDAIEIDYNLASPSTTPTWKFKIQHGDDETSQHNIAPEVDGDPNSDLAGVPTVPGAPPQLVADANGKGSIAKVIALDTTSSATATCTIPTDANRSFVRITVVPERK
jgi:hypothetical protein